MARKLKVWYMGGLWVREAKPAPNGCRQCPAVVATTSRRRAAECFGVSEHELKTFGWECVKPEDIEKALTKPETVFWKDERGDGKWHENLPAKPDYSKYAIWWLAQKDYDNLPELFDGGPDEYPKYVRREVKSRGGRPGKCRLWVPDHFQGHFGVDNWNYSKWSANLKKKRRKEDDPAYDHGGIVVLRCDVDVIRKATKKALGFFTDFKLNIL